MSPTNRIDTIEKRLEALEAATAKAGELRLLPGRGLVPSTVYRAEHAVVVAAVAWERAVHCGGVIPAADVDLLAAVAAYQASMLEASG